MHFTIPLFERRTTNVACVTLGLGPSTRSREGRHAERVRRLLTDELKPVFEKARAAELARFEFPRGIRLEKVRLELTLSGAGFAERRKVSGLCPVVLEPRWASEHERIVFAYHPTRQGEAAPIREELPLDEQLRALFQVAWAGLDDDEIAELWSHGKERITTLSFSCTPRSVLADLPERPGDDDTGADPAFRWKKRRGLKVLPSLGVSLTQRAAQGDLDAGVPRSPQREQLALLLGAGRAQPVVVVGPPGCGKTTLIHRAVLDLLAADGYGAHKNLDRARDVVAVSGRRLIAGMSHLGDWEKRCVELVEDARSRGAILVVDDLHHFGRIGRSRESERSLADFFRGPLSRRELVMVGECSPEAFRLLEQESPSFAALFTPLFLPEATPSETFRLMVREVRALEQRHAARVSPYVLRTILDLGGSLLSAQALPGKAIDLLREVVRAGVRPSPSAEPARGHAPREPRQVGSQDVLRLLSQKTGVPRLLLGGDEPLDADALEEELGRRVIGQPEAVRAAADLVARIKAGLMDPRRPYGVVLFTGPTGTGKTELAKCMAELIYGSASRLLRFDMSELSGPDAPARLLGDRYAPDGLLTQRVREQPFSLVLLDEIEKAHPSVHALLLQLFEDGRLTDAAARPAHFNHAVVVMTSNLGARARALVGFGGAGLPEARALAMAEESALEIARAVRDFFPPELFNRIDRVVPFRPLTPAVAVRVAEKELDRLLCRRGLAERSVFVRRGAGVAERIAREAFVAEDGARSVKRFIEDEIGSLLSDALTRGAPAAMQVIRIFTTARGDGVAAASDGATPAVGDGAASPAPPPFALHREALAEAEPAAAAWALAPLMARPLGALAAELSPLLDFVETLDRSDGLARLSERIRYHLAEHSRTAAEGPEAHGHAEAIYNLDAMRGAIQAFRERIELVRRRSGDDDEQQHLDLEMRRFGYVTVEDEWSRSRVRLFHRRQLPDPLRRPAKQEVLECIAEGHALRRALRKVDEPGQHAVLIELLRAARFDEGPAGARDEPEEGLFEALARAYSEAGGEVEGWACAPLGRASDGDGRARVIEQGRGAAGLDAALSAAGRGAELLVLSVVGLCVLDFFELETGVHVWTSLARGPELVRVRVVPARPGLSPAGAVREHLERQAAFDEAARHGRALPPNPAELLPVVRRVRFDPPRRPGATAPIEIEDYVMGYAESALVRSLSQALAPLWLLRMSREDVA
ncbi:AAA family ATPase [Sorangium sp. So ce1000]|uniref:AAA family ATPase n=1 Tax=Sorangium sp. So ce1000 TaxID=3133325 RepID=UPI003F61039E